MLNSKAKKISLNGWVKRVRKLGNLLFFTLNNFPQEIQVVVKEKRLINQLAKLNTGTLLKVQGKIQAKKTPLGLKEWEIELAKYQIISPTKLLPFALDNQAKINEDTRFRYRYLDLRRETSWKPLVSRHLFLHHLRNYLTKKRFIEIETPLLGPNSPEGARVFRVPSGLAKRYYTLAQSPQIFKQLLIISGFAKHYQIAKSFRQETGRSNRQVEFSQLDLEMSFTTVKQIIRFSEKLLKDVLKRSFGYQLKTPFPLLTYQQAQAQYGTDKPDLRQAKEEFSFVWITNWPLFVYDQEKKKYQTFRHPFTLPQKKFIQPLLNDQIQPERVMSEAFDLVCNGEEILSGSLRIYQPELQKKVLSILGYSESEQKKHFDYFLRALEFAAPPHGGFGLGIDRLLATFLRTKNLKEVIAFPKNLDGSCSLTGTPDK